MRPTVSAWLALRGFSVHRELGLVAWGKLRADLWAFRTVGGNIKSVLIELKSGWADFRSDEKFHLYRKFAHQCYLAIDMSKLNDKQKQVLLKRTKQAQFGILDVRPIENAATARRIQAGHAKVVVKCKPIEVEEQDIFQLLKRIAFRAGIHKRNKKTKLKEQP